MIAAYSNFSNITATIIYSKISVFIKTKEVQKKAAKKPSHSMVSRMSMCQPSPVSAWVRVIMAIQKEAKLESGVIA